MLLPSPNRIQQISYKHLKPPVEFTEVRTQSRLFPLSKLTFPFREDNRTQKTRFLMFTSQPAFKTSPSTIDLPIACPDRSPEGRAPPPLIDSASDVVQLKRRSALAVKSKRQGSNREFELNKKGTKMKLNSAGSHIGYSLVL